jgi:hypothetical protein
MTAARREGRKRGNIEERKGALRVRCYAGIDPVTGRQVYLRATVPGTDDAAWKKADDKLAEFRAQVLKQRSAQSSVNLGTRWTNGCGPTRSRTVRGAGIRATSTARYGQRSATPL